MLSGTPSSTEMLLPSMSRMHITGALLFTRPPPQSS
uniref:Uncharacterized protein n=1 Tax=Anguilla anguilla TaxID=7936 RepID=A0A0E9TGE5_ANGAN